MPIKISVVIPVHNEAPALREFLPALKVLLDDFFSDLYEIIVIDDGSTDEIAAIAQMPRLTVLRHPTRCGSGASRKTGSRVALGDIIAWADGDGTYSPSALVDALNALGDADQVVGARKTDYGRMRRLRLIVKKCTACVASRLWQTAIPDLNSGLRVFRRRSMMTWIDELPDGFSCTSTATLAALNHGQKIIFIPIDYRKRTNLTDSKFHPIWDTLRLWRTLWRMWRRRSKARHLA